MIRELSCEAAINNLVIPDDIPPPPKLPDSSECCGSGCVPCIFDYYFLKLGEWEDRYDLRLSQYEKELKANNAGST